MSDKQRARQFLPFDGLAGYGSLIREAGREKDKKRPLSEDRAAMLDSIVGRLKKGTALEITFYDRDSYRTLQGTLEMVDSIGRRLCLEGKKIDFEDIWEIKVRE
ncbi:hypothetical protein [uncultured Dialister sp.]|uniref:hypothetical protein n=1 Tax=uncultured Dialister sp. TaxID=278064 RepID=UPI00262F5D3D|nr:hypothetical protein [uncultured Dialister sp.]